MKLIDAELVMEKVNECFDACDQLDVHFTALDIIDIIKNAPVVEAEPIIHGHWEYDEISGNNQCSVCFGSDERISGYCNPNDFEYCPWCGAKMDEKGE